MFVPQPYPLFFGQYDDGRPLTGRIIGWQPPENTPDLTQMNPVIVWDNPDGTTGSIGYTDLDGTGYWIRDSMEQLIAAMTGTARPAVTREAVLSALPKAADLLKPRQVKIRTRDLSWVLRKASVVGVNGGEVVLTVEGAWPVAGLAEHAALVSSALSEVLGVDVRVRVVRPDGTDPAVDQGEEG